MNQNIHHYVSTLSIDNIEQTDAKFDIQNDFYNWSYSNDSDHVGSKSNIDNIKNRLQ